MYVRMILWKLNNRPLLAISRNNMKTIAITFLVWFLICNLLVVAIVIWERRLTKSKAAFIREMKGYYVLFALAGVIAVLLTVVTIKIMATIYLFNLK